MAYQTQQNMNIAHAADILNTLKAPFRLLGAAMQTILTANKMAKDLNALFNASDAQLASMGLTRDTIGQYVVRNS